jgi:SAM-dependent methyltransferase
MGLAFSTLSFLLDAYERGVSFKRTLTLGRTQLYLLPKETRKIRRLAGRELSESALRTEFGGFADAFIKSLLGVETLNALDYSDYQGASIVHDMNYPIPEQLEGRFDAVIDAGTIEHVFNFPVAIANCMKMVRHGGRLFMITVANNHCGHGFYQFSPELFFRLFKDQNGFHLDRLLLLNHPFPGVELSSIQRVYAVQDPSEMRQRIGLVTDSPVLLLLEAERRSIEKILATFPQQSDYTTLWQSSERSKNNGLDNVLSHRVAAQLKRFSYTVLIRRSLWPLRSVARITAGFYQKHFLYSFRNRKFYRCVKPFTSRTKK